jgi:hypothetical protein
MSCQPVTVALFIFLQCFKVVMTMSPSNKLKASTVQATLKPQCKAFLPNILETFQNIHKD